MADYDFYNDKTPKRVHNIDRKPTIAQLKSALSTFSSTTYTATVLNRMTEGDLIYACRQNGLTVNTTL